MVHQLVNLFRLRRQATTSSATHHPSSSCDSHGIQRNLFEIIRISLGRCTRPTAILRVLLHVALLRRLRCLFPTNSRRRNNAIPSRRHAIPARNTRTSARLGHVLRKLGMLVHEHAEYLRVLLFPVSHEDTEDVVPVGEGGELVLPTGVQHHEAGRRGEGVPFYRCIVLQTSWGSFRRRF